MTPRTARSSNTRNALILVFALCSVLECLFQFVSVVGVLSRLIGRFVGSPGGLVGVCVRAFVHGPRNGTLMLLFVWFTKMPLFGVSRVVVVVAALVLALLSLLFLLLPRFFLRLCALFLLCRSRSSLVAPQHS